MARKTIDVDKVREWTNNALRNTADNESDYRRGFAQLLDSVLHETGNYKGFSYLDSEYATLDGERDEHAPLLRKGYDDTRRRYA